MDKILWFCGAYPSQTQNAIHIVPKAIKVLSPDALIWLNNMFVIHTCYLNIWCFFSIFVIVLVVATKSSTCWMFDIKSSWLYCFYTLVGVVHILPQYFAFRFYLTILFPSIKRTLYRPNSQFRLPFWINTRFGGNIFLARFPRDRVRDLQVWISLGCTWCSFLQKYVLSATRFDFLSLLL